MRANVIRAWNDFNSMISSVLFQCCNRRSTDFPVFAEAVAALFPFPVFDFPSFTRRRMLAIHMMEHAAPFIPTIQKISVWMFNRPSLKLFMSVIGLKCVMKDFAHRSCSLRLLFLKLRQLHRCLRQNHASFFD